MSSEESDPKIQRKNRKFEIYQGEYQFLRRNSTFMIWLGGLMLFISASLLALLYYPFAIEEILHVFIAVFVTIGFSLLVKGRLAEALLIRYTDSYTITFEVRFSDFGWAIGKMAKFSRGAVVAGLILDLISLPIAMLNIVLGIVVFLIGTTLALWGEQWLTTTEPFAEVDWDRFPEKDKS